MATFPYPHTFPTYSSMEMGIDSLHIGEDSSNGYYSPDGSITPSIISTNYASNRSLGSDTNASSVGSDQLHGEQSFPKKKRKENLIPGKDISPRSAGSVEGKKRRQRKCGSAKEPSKNQKATSQKPSSEYIHVRARRGQATDSHSLAERVRREKIKERMKLLQELVPGCDKVTGKAPVLDEIINYVQSLQSQVEFLSMKLASLNPIMCDFSLDDFYFEQEAEDRRSSPPMAAVHNASHVQTSAFGEEGKNVPFLSQHDGDLYAQQNGYDQKPDLQLQFANITFF